MPRGENSDRFGRKNLCTVFAYNIPDTKRSNEGMRFSFVRFSKWEDAQRAISRLDDFVMLGKKIRVKMVRFSGERKIWGKIQTKDRRSFLEVNQSRGVGLRDKELVKDKMEDKSKVIAASIENEQLWKLQTCLIRETTSLCNLNSLSERIARMGLGELKVKRIQGRFLLIEVSDEDLLEILRQREWSYLKDFFINIEPWSEKFKVSERAVWIKIAGIPLHCWNYQTFKRMVELWGEIIAMGENPSMVNNFDKIEILILTKHTNKIEEVTTLEVGSEKYPIRRSERGLEEKLEEKQRLGEDRMVREEEASSKMDPAINSESKVSPEGRRTDIRIGVNASGMENEGNENREVGLSNVALMEEATSPCNVTSDTSGRESNADPFDMCCESDVVLVLETGLENQKNMEEGNCGSESLEIGGSKIGPRDSRVAKSPLLSKNTHCLEDPVNIGGSFDEDEIGEEIIKSRQNKRNKKCLNKKIRSMREIQDLSLTSKEKKRRDRGSRKLKGKGISNAEESIVNLSLFDSDIGDRRRVILREAKKAWEVGKKLGFSVQGDEGIIIEDLMRIEVGVMRILSWNIRGLGLAPKIEVANRVTSFDFKISAAIEKSGGLLTIWNKSNFVEVTVMNRQRFIVVEGKWTLEGKEAVLINIYAPNCISDQKILWDEIAELNNHFRSD
ncbi:hypothetical protein CXB51_006382 [Gossypium anomalum]|uniref:RRM domain-containing protein n=1 Tax=Gossypium anomalum TaxID=47600 RepID=A0A8J5ZET3_9ROSI|nr:hypothetical protein CXB51_006382 [Gossypium anomalum]